MPDIEGMPTLPALSATSDLPVVAVPEPPPVVESPPAEAAPAADAPADDAAEAADAAEPPASPEPPQLRKGRETAQDRIKQAVARARESDARADRLAALVEKFIADRAAPATPEPPAAPPAPRPTRDQFADPDAYDAALTEWSAQRGAEVAAAKIRQENEAQREAEAKARQESEAKQRLEAVQTTWESKKAELVSKDDFADFDDVAMSPDLVVTENMVPAILNADNGPQVLYHLGKHPEEAARIAALDPLKQVLEIGRLSARLEQPAPPVRRLAEPITPVGSRSPAGPKDPNEMTTEEWAARRLPELQRERKAAMWGRPASAA